jgi:hypothetical protein
MAKGCAYLGLQVKAINCISPCLCPFLIGFNPSPCLCPFLIGFNPFSTKYLTGKVRFHVENRMRMSGSNKDPFEASIHELKGAPVSMIRRVPPSHVQMNRHKISRAGYKPRFPREYFEWKKRRKLRVLYTQENDRIWNTGAK